ncbi:MULTISPECIES: hypothetical protein [unclassified Bradyrhizobium]|nr:MULTISPECIES: hypothetical protein [unclassified Bradyrhizobium]MBR1204458.1 hypothetical protein [Bradyrhizobium sp. AUGA SZCCT0124]MBR1309656.1 hypothetical protein [Bradyrhizobium sp. AUGA SZCCT0051]MBR1339797.1 hypothetical protein [Bradyrhizobium sp. AUGA SZCCT0105]MBR1354404.1 hypothetical protein [Bradyrhizobium sp. AUGA SZCCT0045]
MKERDLLIAQTMAFVQSVKGKLPDAELPTAAPRTAVPPAPAPLPATASVEAAFDAEPAFDAKPAVEAKPALEIKPAAEVQRVVMPPPLPVPTVLEGLPPAPPPLTVTVVEVPPPAQPPQFAKLDISGDFGSEVRERVANFRAQQQRFLKEREEYCTTTMAKVRAAIRDNSELPRSGK